MKILDLEYYSLPDKGDGDGYGSGIDE